MFDRIAGHYDVMNSVMTAGLHHRWRRRAADRARLRPGDVALDVCCGTGDLGVELARRVAPSGHVIGCDFSEPMLDLAREKAAAQVERVRFEWADALELPYAVAPGSTPSRSASGSATSPTSTAASARWRGC